MNSSLYLSLAKTNLKKNSKTYFPYILACICSIAMFYIMDCIAINQGLDKIRSADQLKMILGFAVKVIGMFSIIFLFYTNSFLIKRRKKEIGLYNVLGMEKKHIAKILSIETLIVAIVSMTLGILGGIILGKLLFLVIINLLKIDITISSSFSISFQAIVQTIKLFIIIFTATLLANLFQVKVNNPIELLRGEKVGEKEPKTSWILAIAGVVEIAIGYGIAVTLESPLKAIEIFFLAVILVIVGTYSTFTAGSIALLKLLKKNKKFFYKPKNFISVSGMIYRMKQNAVGLANICILSTAVLLTVSTTVALYAGQEGSLKIAHPLDASLNITNATEEEKETMSNFIKEEASKNNIIIRNKVELNNKELFTIQNGNSFKIKKEAKGIMDGISSINLCTLDEFNKMEGTDKSLDDKEVMIFSVINEFKQPSIVINDNEFKIKEELNKIKTANKNPKNMVNEYFVVVKDMDVLKSIYQEENSEVLENADYSVMFDIDGNSKNILKFCDSVKNQINGMENGDFKSIYSVREDFYIINGGFIFIGCFLGLLFAMSTVLIIYYKQISEGFDDSERFKIMEKVGMSKKEIKSTINKQILMVFFLPLVVAVIHIAVAFNVVSKMLSLFGLYSTSTLIIAIAITIVIFAIMYAIVYLLTARTYYKIVQQEN